jgi:hypothetical protein
VRPSRISLLPTAILLAVSGGCGQEAPPTPVASDCSPRRWAFDSGEGVQLDPSTALLDPTAHTGLAPPFMGRQESALLLPIRFGPENYFVGVNVKVCQPSETATFLGQRLSVRLLVEGPLLADSALITLWLWPQLEGAMVPLPLRRTGEWVTYAGVTPRFRPGTGHAQPSDVVIDFTYTGEVEWEGKIWIDDLQIAPP